MGSDTEFLWYIPNQVQPGHRGDDPVERPNSLETLTSHATALEAMWLSIKATFWNLPAMAVWSSMIVVLTALGFAPFLLGMIIVAPVLGHATWHAYRDLIE